VHQKLNDEDDDDDNTFFLSLHTLNVQEAKIMSTVTQS
jgi:hypothetical protein